MSLNRTPELAGTGENRLFIDPDRLKLHPAIVLAGAATVTFSADTTQRLTCCRINRSTGLFEFTIFGGKDLNGESCKCKCQEYYRNCYYLDHHNYSSLLIINKGTMLFVYDQRSFRDISLIMTEVATAAFNESPCPGIPGIDIHFAIHDLTGWLIPWDSLPMTRQIFPGTSV